MNFCGYIESEINNTKDFNLMLTKLTNCPNPAIYIDNYICIGGNLVYTKNYQDNFYTVFFNGNILNLEDIQKDLIEKGYIFETKNNLETICLACIHYKEKCLELFDGNFSFGVYDKTNKTLFLARDRLGIFPLYYANIHNTLIFSTEIKCILEHSEIDAKIGKDEICEIFGLGPAHTPGKTFFKDIYEIRPGEFLTYINSEIHTTTYWDLPTFQVEDTVDESIKKTKELVYDSFKRNYINAPTTCTMLSGGLDSSVLTYLASKEIESLPTFSIDFENNQTNFTTNSYQPTRDNDYIQLMKDFLQTKHTMFTFTTQDLYDALKTSMIARDMPGMADVDSSMLVFLREIKKAGFTTAISGECSDEIFGGYPWYYKEELIQSTTFPWARSIGLRKSIINKDIVDSNYLEEYVKKAYDETAKKVIYISDDETENTFRKTCYLTIKWFMNTLVERTVRASNIIGIDVRVPFADYRIFEYIYNVNSNIKLGLINENNTPIEKYLLRKAFERELPYEVVYRKKSPFPKTYDPQYIQILETEIKNIINKSTSSILQIIDVKYLYELLDTHGTNLTENWFGQLMTYPQTLAYLIQVNMWLEEYDIQIDV